MLIIAYQTNTGHRAVSFYNESNAQNKFTFKCRSCHAFKWSCTFEICLLNIFLKSLTNTFCLLPSFFASTVSIAHRPLSGHFLHLKHFEAPASLCVVNGMLLEIGRNLWHSLLLQSQISNFPYSLKNLSPVWNYFRWIILCFHLTRHRKRTFSATHSTFCYSAKIKQGYFAKYQKLCSL